MDELRILAPNGVCGSGFLEESFEAGLAEKPHFIGCDAGSTDPGPSHLGNGTPAFPRAAVMRDFRIMLKGARRAKVPFLIGSVGTAGGDLNVKWFMKILKEVSASEKLKFKLAVINAEQKKSYLKKKLAQGRIKPLDPAPEFNDKVIDRSAHIVGMMGTEPYEKALKAGAEVIVAGRSSDTAIFAAIPMMKGFPKGLSWHMAKIMECGAACVVNRKSGDSMFAWLRKDHFVVRAPDPELRCSPQSVASHSLYENGDPFKLVESSGTLDLTNSKYEALDERSVKVSGSGFIPADRYTVKLEGAELAGYQSIVIGSIRDPFIIRQLDDWTERLKKRIHARISQVYKDKLKPDEYVLNMRLYGKNGTMGDLEPVKEIRSHEICMIIEITAKTQEIASTIAGIIRHQALHLPIPEWSGLITSIACPYNPAHLDRGPVYRFNVNHVVEPEDPYEMFPMKLYSVNGSTMKELKK